MSNFALQAQTDNAYLLPLWQSVERLITLWARQYIKTTETRLLDADDLVQAGYLAMTDALRTYDPDKGAFTTHLRYHVRCHFNGLAGIRTTKRRPEHYSVSLNVPISEDGTISLMDTISDPEAQLAFDDVIEREAARQDADAILTEINKLEEQLRLALLLTGYQGLSLAETAELMNVSPERVRQCRNKAVLKIRNTRAGRLIEADYYRHVSLAQFRTTHTSSVEEIILWLEEMGSGERGNHKSALLTLRQYRPRERNPRRF